MFSRFQKVLGSTFLLLSVAACGLNDIAEKAAAAKDNVAATVNGIPIRESLVRLMLEQRASLGHGVDPAARKAYIDRLALQALVAQAAVKQGLDQMPEVADRLELSRNSILVDAYAQNYFKHNPVSDASLQAAYEDYKAKSGGTEYRASHILVETEAEAKNIISKLNKNPAAFAQLARQASQDTGSKANGGDLGWFSPQQVVPEFGDAVAKLAKGKFTEVPVKSQFGYHVILLQDTRTKATPAFEQVKPLLKREVQQQNLKQLVDDMMAQAKIEIAEPAPALPAARAAESSKR